MLIATVLLFSHPPVSISQETIAPPSLGQQTQGEPADIADISNIEDSYSVSIDENQNKDQSDSPDLATKLLGTTNIIELRRENGQVYRIELEHSSGSKQTIEEFDSDGLINSSSSGIEKTPNLPKWRLGSW